MSEGERDIKVTDKRMFGPDGSLREEFRYLDDREAATGAPGPEASGDGDESVDGPPPGADRPPAFTGSPAQSSPAVDRAAPSDRPPASASEERARVELPPSSGGFGAPGFLDLVAMLAEPVAIYLGDVELPDGRQSEDLEMARLHIDLLELLRTKTAGNLTSQESAVLDDILYRVRLRYVQKRG